MSMTVILEYWENSADIIHGFLCQHSDPDNDKQPRGIWWQTWWPSDGRGDRWAKGCLSRLVGVTGSSYTTYQAWWPVNDCYPDPLETNIKLSCECCGVSNETSVCLRVQSNAGGLFTNAKHFHFTWNPDISAAVLYEYMRHKKQDRWSI